MKVSVTTSVMTFETTVPSVLVTACCAPITSLLSRRLQRAGLGAGEERDRHALHVVEQRDPQVVDEALADPGRVPALEQAEPGVGERERRRRPRRGTHDERPVLVRDGGVEQGPEQQRRDDADDRADDHG